MLVQDLDQQELIDLAELLNQILLDQLYEPVEAMYFTTLEKRIRLVKTFLWLAKGDKVDLHDLKRAQDFYDEVVDDEES